MDTYYLIDLFDDSISSVENPATSQLLVGKYAIRIPAGINITPPTNLSSLISKKYQAILGYFGYFSNIAFDDMLDSSGVDTSGGSGTTGVILGDKGHVGFYPQSTINPVLVTVTNVLPWSGPGAGPSQIVLDYELFAYQDVDGKASRYSRSVVEKVPDTDATCQISFDGGVTYTLATNKAITNIALADQGVNMVLKFTRSAGAGRVYLGSWAVLY